MALLSMSFYTNCLYHTLLYPSWGRNRTRIKGDSSNRAWWQVFHGLTGPSETRKKNPRASELMRDTGGLSQPSFSGVTRKKWLEWGKKHEKTFDLTIPVLTSYPWEILHNCTNNICGHNVCSSKILEIIQMSINGACSVYSLTGYLCWASA